MTKAIKFFIRYSYMVPRFILKSIYGFISYWVTYYKFLVYDVNFKKFKTNGVPVVELNDNAKLYIGENLYLNNGGHFNKIGRQQPCFLIATLGGTIKIGNNVGLSSTAIHCNEYIEIGNFVKIGGNTVIYDTNFHSLDYLKRQNPVEDLHDIQTKPVIIKDNVFIGAHSTILKGVTIGENSIIGACSVVTRNVPSNEIWAGSPAIFIKKIDNV